MIAIRIASVSGLGVARDLRHTRCHGSGHSSEHRCELLLCDLRPCRPVVSFLMLKLLRAPRRSVEATETDSLIGNRKLIETVTRVSGSHRGGGRHEGAR